MLRLNFLRSSLAPGQDLGLKIEVNNECEKPYVNLVFRKSNGPMSHEASAREFSDDLVYVSLEMADLTWLLAWVDLTYRSRGIESPIDMDLCSVFINHAKGRPEYASISAAIKLIKETKNND